MTKDEKLAMDLALEALTFLLDEWTPARQAQLKGMEAVTAIKQARALDKKAENARELGLDYEPVTWRNAAIRVGEDLCSVGPFGYYDMTAEQWLDWALSVVTVHAPPAQPAPTVLEPVGYITQARCFVHLHECTEAEAKLYGWKALYTTPLAAQRQWVGLTHDEFIDLCEEAGNFGSGSLIRHIEAKLKEKNT
jgi:hypothetical protein